MSNQRKSNCGNAEIRRQQEDDAKTLREIFRFIRENEIYSLAELLDITAENKPEWFALIALHKARIVDQYIRDLRSLRYGKPNDIPQKGD